MAIRRSLFYRCGLAMAVILAAAAASGCGVGYRHAGDSGSLVPTQSPANANFYERNHPVRIAVGKKGLTIELLGGELAILSDRQRGDIGRFIQAYKSENGRDLLLQVPQADDQETQARLVASVVDSLQSIGVPRPSYAIYTLRQSAPAPAVRLSYVSYQISPPDCEDWDGISSQGSAGLRPSRQLGCSVLHNRAAIISDPYDLVAPAPLSPADAERNTLIYDNYRQGQETQSGRELDAENTSDAFR